MTLLDLGLSSGGNHPAYAAHLNSDLFGGLSTSGVLYEPVAMNEFAHPLGDIASVTEVQPDIGAATDLSGQLMFKRWCDCCPDSASFDFATDASQPIRGDVFSKFAPTAYVVEASAFSALSLGQDILNNVAGGPVITGASLSAGANPQTQVVVAATIS